MVAFPLDGVTNTRILSPFGQRILAAPLDPIYFYFVFQGHDTVSTSLIMAMYLIGRHPEVQKKIQEELERVFGKRQEPFILR